MGGIETIHHHGSHRRLIWPVDEPAPAVKVDAIIVPTARPVDYLKEAAAAAASLRCPLVTLHSRSSSAYQAIGFLDPGIDLIAIDVPKSAQLWLPEWETSWLLKGTRFERPTDVSNKRNLALVLSHMLRWKRVIFLDDDIHVPDPGDLSKAASLLDTHPAVGLGIGGYPDNSVVCHAFREAGGWQETFIGAGALAVEVKRNRTFFPSVYNEDWLFVLEAGKGLQSVATVGQVLQDPYNPYRPERARAEEFGDVLAEGTFWLLDQGRSVADCDRSHWRSFLARRKMFIEQVAAMVESKTEIEAGKRLRMAEALSAALAQLREITPDLCVDYLQALVTDQGRWQQHIQAVRRHRKLPLEATIESLASQGGYPLTWCTRKAEPPQKRGTADGRGPRVLPRLRRVQVAELRALIPSPPPALVPRVFTAAKRALPGRPRAAVAPSHAAHAPISAEVALGGEQCHTEGDDHGDEGPFQ